MPTGPDPGQLDGRFQPGERLAATRTLLRGELSRPLLLGRWLRLVPALRGAASAYAFDAAVEPIANAWSIASATAETEVARRFGALRHSIVPRLAWRAGSAVSGRALPAFGYDGWDRVGESPPGAAATFAGPRLVSAAQPGVFQQGRASVETRLDGPAGELLHVELGQDLDLRTGDLAESFATLRAVIGPVSASGSLRYSGFATRPALTPGTALRVEDWTEVRGALRLARAGYDLHAEISSIGAGGSPSAQGGLDALFDLRPTPLARSAAVAAGFRLPIGPATLVYDLYFPPRDVAAPLCDGEGTRTVRAYSVQQQAGSLVWNSPCRCFRATITVKYNDCGGFGFTGGIDLSPGETAAAGN
jgi:LPS-assembly protein